MLFAQRGGLSLAVACSAKWLRCSVGYVGVSDGWTDLSQHKKLTWEYANADHGNIALKEEKGFSTFTLAAEIAGLLAAADLAEANREGEVVRFLKEQKNI